MSEYEETSRLPEWRGLYEDALSWPYDVVVPHDRIARLVGADRESDGPKYYGRVNRAIQELRLDCRHMVCVRGEGYKILRPGEVICSHVDHIMEKADRVVGRAQATAVSVDTNELTLSEQCIQQYKIDRLAWVRRATEKTKVDLIARAPDVPKLVLNSRRELSGERAI